jgi:hypothetical protein
VIKLVVTAMTNRVLSPLATITAIFAIIDQRAFKPVDRHIFGGHSRYRFKHLIAIACAVIVPKGHDGFHRRTAGHLAVQFCNQDDAVCRQAEAFAGPVLDDFQGCDVFMTLSWLSQHRVLQVAAGRSVVLDVPAPMLLLLATLGNLVLNRLR